MNCKILAWWGTTYHSFFTCRLLQVNYSMVFLQMFLFSIALDYQKKIIWFPKELQKRSIEILQCILKCCQKTRNCSFLERLFWAHTNWERGALRKRWFIHLQGFQSLYRAPENYTSTSDRTLSLGQDDCKNISSACSLVLTWYKVDCHKFLALVHST